jgi:tetratricopeptide (TPR) repeat protein
MASGVCQPPDSFLERQTSMAGSPSGAAANPPSKQDRASSRRTIGVVALLFLPIVGVGWWLTTERTEHLIVRGRVLLAQRKFDEAREVAKRVLARDRHSVPAALLAAETAVAAGQPAEALEYLETIPDDGSLQAVDARIMAANLLLTDRKVLEPSEQHVRRALRMAPDSLPANETLAYLLGLQSRSWEAIPFRLHLLTLGKPTSLILYFLSLADGALENPEELEALHKASPDDPAVQLAVARVQLELKNYTEAEKLAKAAAQKHPEWAEAYVQWGRAVLELGVEDRFSSWDKAVSKDAEAHPGIWYVRGSWALKKQQTPTAVRCFWEVLRRDPNHPKACYQLGQALATLQRKSEADVFLERSKQLETYVRLTEVSHNLQQAKTCLQAARQAEKLGMLWEAWGWAQVARELDPRQTAAVELAERLTPRLDGLPLVRSAPGSSPAESIDLSEFPLPQPGAKFRNRANPTLKYKDPQTSRNSITFEDSASAAGLKFDYYNAGEPRTKGLIKMYEVVGGGVAVLDYDQDGAPDLYLPQGSPWPLNADQRTYLDQIFRNTGGQFQNVTEQTRIIEPGFSQGATVGDVNDDGFPDIYVANISGNRLFINDGDGTFHDATPQLGAAEPRYTASAVIADINGDLWPDIYAVNYLAGDDLFTRVCGDNEGHVGSCLPQLFAAAPDQLFLNLGDGRFEEISHEAGVADTSGKGLGIVAWAAKPGGSLRLFIANDVGPNFLYVNQASPEQRPRFTEEGLLAGVAVNYVGRSESSMGIAAGDCDGNGLLDLFVTNFDDETNTLYEQQSEGTFIDRTAAAQLNRKREPYVGWGTQFLDADLDGWLDLILTNGHVNDARRNGKPFQMPTEFFRNLGNGKFENVRASSLGPFFEGQRLGRGLARLDWNADGRDDVVITHLDAPAALLTNTTRQSGRYFALELRGIQSARDAIGTIVQARVGGRTLTQQLTAGDGNQCSNERKLIFGLGLADHIDRLEIHWPSGHSQSFTNLPADTAWMAIEGRTQLVSRPSNRTANSTANGGHP